MIHRKEKACWKWKSRRKSGDAWYWQEKKKKKQKRRKRKGTTVSMPTPTQTHISYVTRPIFLAFRNCAHLSCPLPSPFSPFAALSHARLPCDNDTIGHEAMHPLTLPFPSFFLSFLAAPWPCVNPLVWLGQRHDRNPPQIFFFPLELCTC